MKRGIEMKKKRKLRKIPKLILNICLFALLAYFLCYGICLVICANAEQLDHRYNDLRIAEQERGLYEY